LNEGSQDALWPNILLFVKPVEVKALPEVKRAHIVSIFKSNFLDLKKFVRFILVLT
jgi:hypothetical protein